MGSGENENQADLNLHPLILFIITARMQRKLALAPRRRSRLYYQGPDQGCREKFALKPVKSLS
jgi:hypothetical protein